MPPSLMSAALAWVVLTFVGGDALASDPAWVEAEKGILKGHVQLTSSDMFRKAGESYFSPDGTRIIFQAIEKKADPADEERFYQMYVADLVRVGGKLTGIDRIKRLSPPGSSNTCGWFHPTEPGVVIFGCTRGVPSNPDQTGYKRGSRDYSWQFPKEMDIVRCDTERADGTAKTLVPIVEDKDAYLAECVIRNDGRYLVYCQRVVKEGQAGGDLLVRDLVDGRTVPVTGSAGYDGGPFFSPDGKRICYRSDRQANDLLQVFVAELKFDDAGNILGVDREFQLTDNGHVNWAPYWHPNGRQLIYTSSERGHDNYEVLMIDADAGGNGRSTKYGTRKRRITNAAGFDGLPVFNADGSLMMWTSQRSADASSQVWVADFVLPMESGDVAPAAAVTRAEPAPLKVEAPVEEEEPKAPAPVEREGNPNRLQVADPATGLIYIYDMSVHRLSVYDPKTHAVRDVTDAAEKSKAMKLFEGG